MTAIKKLTDSSGVQYFPQTHTKAVVDDQGNSVEGVLGMQTQLINQAQLEVGAVPSDIYPTEGSTNWPTSGGVWSELYDSVNVFTNSSDVTWSAGNINSSGALVTTYANMYTIVNIEKDREYKLHLDNSTSFTLNTYKYANSKWNKISELSSLTGEVTKTFTITDSTRILFLLFDQPTAEQAQAITLSLNTATDKYVKSLIFEDVLGNVNDFVGIELKAEIFECYYVSAYSTTQGVVKYIGASGYYVTDYIDVHDALKVTFPSLKGTSNSSVRSDQAGYAFYNVNKEVVSCAATVTATSWTTGTTEVEIPNGAYYIRFTTYGQEQCLYTLWNKRHVLNSSDVVDNLDDGGSDVPLSAEQGKVLNGKTAIDEVDVVADTYADSKVINAKVSDTTFGQEIATSTTDSICITDYIDCSKYSRISFYGLRGASSAGNAGQFKGGIVFYDDEKNPIEDGAHITQVVKGNYSYALFDIAVPENASYFRYTFWHGKNETKAILREPNKNLVYKSEIVNNLTDGGEEVPLSAEQGKVLQDLASYVDERDTSVFTGDTQDETAATIEKVNDEWVITKGTQNSRGVGLFIGTIPATREYTWEIEYSNTSIKDSAIRFSTQVNTQQATHRYFTGATFLKNSNHRKMSFKATREDSNYLTITSTDLTGVITIHNIRVYYRQSVQEIGEILDSGTSGGGGSSSTNYANAVSLYSNRKALADNMKNRAAFSCLMFSDIHGDTTNFGRILDIYDAWEGYFTCGINVGDTIYDNLNPGNSWYWDMLGEREFLFAIGNHDMWGGSGGYNNAIEQDEYDAWIAPLATKITGLVRPSNADTNLLPYYYKDYGNIRVIVLSIYSNRLSSDLQWFEGVLADAITNEKKVIVVNHIAHSLFARRESTATHNLALDGYYNNGFITAIGGVSQQGYIDAPSPDTDNIGNGFVVAVKNFMDNGGTFITWISGHTHRDFFTDLSGTSHEATCGKQAFITLSTARASYQGDNPQTWPDGTGMDSFYMFSVAEDLGIFKLMKFGAETDAAMRPRKFMAYSYIEHKMVANL